MWFAVCALAALLASLGAVAAVNSASDRISVVAVARDVPVGSKLTEKDLVVAEVARDPALKPVSAGKLKELVGQHAAVDLRKGGLLTASQVSEDDVLADGKQVVGVQVKRGQVPNEALHPGDQVLIVFTPPASGEQQTPTDPKAEQQEQPPIQARVVAVGDPDATGALVVNLAVPPTDGPVVAARAASGTLALVLQPRTS